MIITITGQKMDELKVMETAELMEEFEKTIRYWHYDYNMEKPKYSLDEIREEMVFRLKKVSY